jgi:hypothetical protein
VQSPSAAQFHVLRVFAADTGQDVALAHPALADEGTLENLLRDDVVPRWR